MDDRFGDLTDAARACLDAAHLLGRAGVAPLTRRRLAAVQAGMLGRGQPEPQLNAALEELGARGLLTSSLGDELVICGPNGLPGPDGAGAAPCTEADLALLIRVLAPLGDFDELHGLARRRSDDGSPDQALNITLAILLWLTKQAPPDFPEQCARGLHNAGVSLVLLRRLAEALPYFERTIERFSADADEKVAKHVAAAMYGKYYALHGLGQTGEAAAAFDALTERFGGASSPAIRITLLKAYGSRANDLFDAGAANEAFDIYRAIDIKLGNDSDPAMRELAALAMLNHARALGLESRFIDQLECYRGLAGKFRDNLTDKIRGYLVDAAIEGAQTLARLGRRSESEQELRLAYERHWMSGSTAIRAALDAALLAQTAPAGAFRIGEIDAGWMPTPAVPETIVAAAVADLEREGPEGFRHLPSIGFGWQPIAAAPGWWLVRLIPRSEFWGYGLYCLWTPGRMTRLAGAGIELRSLSREGLVHLDTPAAAWEWYRLRGICEIVDGHPKYTLADGVDTAVTPHEQGWCIACCRITGKRLQKVRAVMNRQGRVLEEELTELGESTSALPSDALMTPAVPGDYLMSVIHDSLTSATEEEKKELAHMNWRRREWLAKLVAVPVVAVTLIALVGWRLGRLLAVLPLLPGLLVSRHVPSALDVRADLVHQFFAFMEGRARRRVLAISLWYAAFTCVCAFARLPYSLMGVVAIAVSYAHTTFVFLRNESTRLAVFRHAEEDAQYLSQLHDFVAEYALCAALFLATLPLLVSRLSEPFLQYDPQLPTTIVDSYQFTLHALLLQVPDIARARVPYLSSLAEPKDQYGNYLQSGIQYMFQMGAVSLLLDKIWAARGLRGEARSRLARSLQEAVALGGRATRTLLRVIADGIDPGKVRMAVLALGLIAEPKDRERLLALKAAGALDGAAAELSFALALLGDDVLPADAPPLVLQPSLHGGDEPLDLGLLVAALRSQTPSSAAIAALRRMLLWQGVSVRIRHAAMLALLRIPGAFSARNAIDWTKEFVGPSITTSGQFTVLKMFGEASLNLPVEELAVAISNEWMYAPMSTFISLLKYQGTSMGYRMCYRGADGYRIALFVAMFHGMESRKVRRKLHRWRIVDLVLWRLYRWGTLARTLCFAAAMESGFRWFQDHEQSR